MLTPKEVEQYARMTLKQWGLSDYIVVFQKLPGNRWGQANPWESQIELSEKCLASFESFRLTLLHEIAHCLDFKERGTFKKNGRNNFHGASFKKWCKVLGVASGRKIKV